MTAMVKSMSRSGATFSIDSEYKLLFLALVYVDAVLSFIAIQTGFIEQNPIMVQVLASIPLLVLIKGIAPALMAWLVPGKFLMPSIALMGAVLAWNLKEIAGL